jgi:hypothetical protein
VDGIAAVGVKVFKATDDARREARRLLPFHREGIYGLPGLPNARVQRSIDARMVEDGSGAERLVIIQEWVAGESLDQSLRRWAGCPPDCARVRSVLRQLLGEIIIPLWHAGLIWWDVRAANYCYDEARDRLALIDVDSLAAYADEILRTPDRWERREKGRMTALARLRQLTLRIAGTQPHRTGARAAATTAAWRAELEPALRALGREPQSASGALIALDRFLARLADRESHSRPGLRLMADR